jgi:hypothetical protein
MNKLNQTKREEELRIKYKELKNKKLISINELDDFLNSVFKVQLELERMRKRYNQLKEKGK